jgi:hypothetical protein
MSRFSFRFLLSALTAAIIPFSAQAASVTVSVAGTDNPFLAGQPNGATCCSGDSAPAESPTLALTGFAAGTALSFSGVGGFLNEPGTPVALDGYGAFSMDASNFGISGVQNIGVSALVGVFLDNAVPNGTAPAARDDGVSFASISPELGQIFFIGDGLTGSGTGSVQQFFAPTGATRLFLGSSDGFGWYNNIGDARVTIDYTAAGVVPEPASWAMLIAGFGLVGATMRRRPRTAIRFA